MNRFSHGHDREPSERGSMLQRDMHLVIDESVCVSQNLYRWLPGGQRLRPWRVPLAAPLLLMLGVLGCTDRTSKTYLTRPQTGRYALSGRVLISGTLFSESGQPTATRVVDDASGVWVRLLRPDGSRDSTLAINGAFEFRSDDPGLYRAYCWVVAPDTVATSDVTISGGDAA